MESLVFIDNEDITDPATNLAIEEYALRYLAPEHDYLMLYRNNPSVIVGRNQNVLEEIDDTYTRESGIRVLRRLSGGGTVYHDPGNLNFSFITRYEQSRLHNFHFFNAPIVRILRSHGVPAEMNDRNDILANGRKISGSAQFSSKGRMFSHGTLLFDSKLDEIDRILSGRMKKIQSRSHKSVRSAVANISGFLREPMDIITFRNCLFHGLIPDGRPDSRYTLSKTDRMRIREIRDSRYRTWEWNIGRSPRFQLTRSRLLKDLNVTLSLEVQKGHIEKLQLYAAKPDRPAGSFTRTTDVSTLDFETGKKVLDTISHRLTGLRYDPDAIRTALANGRLEVHNSEEEPVAGFIAGVSNLLYGSDE